MNTHTVYAILAWLEGENTKARNNGLATTRSGHGGTNFNPSGVKNYPTFAAGMAATVETIRLAPYRALLAEIHKGTSAHRIVAAIEAAPWGTHDIPLDAILAKPELYAAIRLHS